MTSIKIDQIDAKILKDLLQDGRKNFNKIAKEAGVSKDIIWQHYKKLKNDGIIVGATVQLNYARLGYYTVGSIFVTIDPKNQDQIVKSIKKLQNIYGVNTGNGPKIWVVATLKSMEELDDVKHAIKQVPSVLGMQTEIWIGIRHMVDNLSVLSIGKKASKPEKTDMPAKDCIKKTKSKIDKTDIQLIEKLSKNSRLSFRKIAKELNVSTDTVSRRYRKLEQNGIIKSVIQINPIKLGYVGRAMFNLAFISQKSSSEVIDKISIIPDIVLILKTSGVFDLSITARVKDMEHLFSIQDKIVSISGITRMETTMTRGRALMPGPKTYISTF
ncbi:MAG: hypothetical protein CW691_11915 [Candidatus Bathyarchaeum sp.]|nr:MAG: hypothetical protein CW691_11915 [Candidatus Bathyarchaeum sp.]